MTLWFAKSMSSLHICYVEMGYPHHHGGGGGAGTYVQIVGRELVRRGHHVTVVTAPCNQCSFQSLDKGIRVFRPPVHSLLHGYVGKIPGVRVSTLAIRYLEQMWSIARFVEQLHKQHRIDIVEYAEGGDFWHAFKAPFPYIANLHGSRYTFLRMADRPLGRVDWYHRRLELEFIRRACCIVSPSQVMIDLTEQELGCILNCKAVLPLPLDPRLLASQPVSEDEVKVRQVVLFAARNDPVKGADILLNAVPMVRQHCPGVEFHLFGYTPSLDVKLPGGVYCHPFVAKEQLLTSYHRADICVVPSLWDNSPNTIYEAMAAGKAVVASRVGGIPELIEDGETGILVQPKDPVRLAESIVRLLRDEDTRLAMGRKGRERILGLADLDENVGRRVDLYRQIIAEWTSRKSLQSYAHRPR
jgi:glycosyltransferase involved in cell wall biosynthesis